jgi:hypothetical protein
LPQQQHHTALADGNDDNDGQFEGQARAQQQQQQLEVDPAAVINVRAAFVAPAGRLLISADYSQVGWHDAELMLNVPDHVATWQLQP